MPRTFATSGGSGGGGSPGGTGTNLQYRASSSTFGGLLDSAMDTTNGYLGLGGSPTVRAHVFSKDTTIADPTGFNASLVLATPASPPTDSPAFLYGPQSTSGFGTENPAYSGYTNNDSVDAFILPYRIIGGTPWVASPGSLGNVTLSSNPSGIDWSWSAAVNGDGSGVDGYIINIIDNTMGTNYTYDVGNTTSYADMNIGGSVTYTLFSGFTASGQSFNFEPYNIQASPSGTTSYSSASGGDFPLNESFNNGSQFWIVHTFSGSSGSVFLLDTTNSNSTTTTNNPFYQTGPMGGGGSNPYPTSFGYLSDGSTLNFSFSAYSMATSPSTYFSSGSSDSTTTDPNDGQYYYVSFTISSIGGGTGTRVLRQDGYHADPSSYPFAMDTLGTNFVIGSVVTPAGLTSSAVIAQNSASAYDQFAALEIVSTGSSPAIAWFDNTTERMRMGYDPSNSTNFIKTANGTINFRNGTNTTLATISSNSVVFNQNQNSSWSFLIRTPNSNPIFGVFGSSDSIAIGPSANTSAWINYAAGSSTKHQTNFATSASLPASASSGAFNFNGSNLSIDLSAYRARVLQTGTATILSSGNFPVVDGSGNLRDSSLSLVGGFGGTVIQANLQFEAKQGIQLDASKNIDMGNSSNITFTTTGSKIGTATTQKFAFWNAAPIAQPTGNIITALTNLGLVATPTLPASSVSSGAALTKTDDTNVTLTLGGTPTTALLTAASLTLGWTGQLSVARGGTGQATPVVVANSFSQVGAATTTFTVTIGTTQANTTYKVNVTPTALLSAAAFYINNKTTTTFDVVYLAGLTGTVTFDWALFT